MALMTCSRCGAQYYGVGCPQCDYPQPSSDRFERRRQLIGGVIALAVGLPIDLVALLHKGSMSDHILAGIIGMMFTLAGLQLLTNAKGRVSWLMATLMCAGFSAVFFAAAFGPGAVSGGVPFLPWSWNQHLGKFMFGCAGVGAALMALWALRQAVRGAPTSNADKGGPVLTR